MDRLAAACFAPLRSRFVPLRPTAEPADAEASAARPSSPDSPENGAGPPTPARQAGAAKQQGLREQLLQRQLEQKAKATAYLDKQLRKGAVVVAMPEHWHKGSLQLGPQGESVCWHGAGRKEVLDLAEAVYLRAGRGLRRLVPPSWRTIKPSPATWPVPGLYSLRPCGFYYAVGRDAEEQPWLVQVSPQGTEMRARMLLPNLLEVASGANVIDAAGELLLGWYPSAQTNERQLCLVDLTRRGKPLPLAIGGPVPHPTARKDAPPLEAQLSRDGAWLCLNQSPELASNTAELFRIQRKPALRLERERLFEQVHSAQLSPSGRSVFLDPTQAGRIEMHHRTGPALKEWHSETLANLSVPLARWSPNSDAVVGSDQRAQLVRLLPLQTAGHLPLPAPPTVQSYPLPGALDLQQLPDNLLLSGDGHRALVPLATSHLGHRSGRTGRQRSEPGSKFALLSFDTEP